MDSLNQESIKKLSSIGYKMGILTVDDLAGMTAPQLIVKIANKLNELVYSQNDLIGKVDEWVQTQTLQGLQEILEQMMSDGTIAEVINQQVFGQINQDINHLKKYQYNGMSEISIISHPAGMIDEMNIIRTKDNQVVMIDCGGQPEVSGIASYFDDKLMRLGIDHVDKFIITHFHSDHAGNAVYFIEKFKPSEVIYKEVNWNALPTVEASWGTRQIYESVKSKCQELGIPFIEAKNRGAIILNSDEYITLLNTEYYDANDYNEASLFCVYNNRNKRIGFGGDIGPKAFNTIKANIPTLDILKLPHHGALYNQSEHLARNTHAKIAIINSLDMPSADVPKGIGFYRYQEAKIISIRENDEIVSFLVGNNVIVDSNKPCSCHDEPIFIYGDFDEQLYRYYQYPSTFKLAVNCVAPVNGGLDFVYIESDYRIAQSGTFPEQIYCIDSDGKLARCKWLQDKGYWYYYKLNGQMAINETVRIESKDYVFNHNGVCTNPEA